MKRQLFFIPLFLVAILFASCEKDKTTTVSVNFEDVALNSDDYWDGSDLSGTPATEETPWGSVVTNYYGGFTANKFIFSNVYTYDEQWPSWTGFACSATIDTETAGYLNQYSSITGNGAGSSKNYAVAYNSAGVKCPTASTAVSVMLTNSTYTYLYMKNGDSGDGAVDNNKFTAGAWLKVAIKGYLSNSETGSVEHYLGDFQDGKTFIANTWNKVDLSALGKVDSLNFTITSSDNFAPSYVCVDDLTFTQDLVVE